MSAVVRVGWAAVRRRRVQSIVIGVVVLLSSATAVLAIGLLVASDAPFDRAFARQHGAHAAAAFDATKVTTAALGATASRPGVTAAAGPYDTVSAQLGTDERIFLPDATIAGRRDAGGAVDRLVLTEGHWLTGPDQIVVAGSLPGEGHGWKIGDKLTVGVAGKPALTIVGIAGSVTGTADAWVWPTRTDVLHAAGAVTSEQMLYRFTTASTATAVRTSLATATAGLPAGSLSGSTSWLSVKLTVATNVKLLVPFVVAFAVLGLVMSVLIVVNVVSGAVVAGFRVIGVQKTLGFTPGQVMAVYAGQVLAVAVPACVLGVVAGRLGSLPLLAQTDSAYTVAGGSSIPFWVDGAVLLSMVVAVGAAALVTAARAGRMPAVQAITTGRAPRAGRGFRVRRALAATRLPRPISFGLATPFARPARSAVTVIAVLLGATTVVFAIGLATSLSRVMTEFDRAAAAPVEVQFTGPVNGAPVNQGPANHGTVHQGAIPPGAARSGPQPVDPTAVRAKIAAQPGTAHIAGLIPVDLGMAGYAPGVQALAYDSDASWTGYTMMAGRWYSGPDEVVASSHMLRLTGSRIGDTITLTHGTARRTVRIVGEAFTNGDATIVMDAAGLTGLTDATQPLMYEVGLERGTNQQAYVRSLQKALGDQAAAQLTTEAQQHESIVVAISLIVTLSVLLCAVAALGVFNTVVLNTRERVQEIGVLKSIGMTPAQVRVVVITSMAALGLLGGVLAVPIGFALHRHVLSVTTNAVGTDVPPGVTSVFGPAELIALGLAGIVIAAAGALVPAGWAARTRVATALRAE